MKTTVEISDALLLRARAVQQLEAVTLKALIEEGLQLVIAPRLSRPPYRFEPVIAGQPITNPDAWLDMQALTVDSRSGDAPHIRNQMMQEFAAESDGFAAGS